MASAVLLLAALALAPIIGGGFGELAASVLQLLVIGGIGVYLLFPRRAPGSWARVPGAIALGIFVAAVVASIFFSETLYASLRQLLLIATCIGGYCLAASLCRDSRFAAVAVWVVVMSALFVCALGIGDYATSTGGGVKFWEHILSTGEHMRLFGPFFNPDFFAGYIVIALPITLGVYLVTRRVSLAIVSGIGFVVETLALMLTGAKLGIISAVVALLVFAVLSIATKSLRRFRFVRLIVIAAVLLPLLILFSGPVRSRIVAAEAGGTQVHSTTFRYFTWSSTIEMIADRPWFGVGAGAFGTAYPRYATAGPTPYAHQSYLQIAAESGLIALCAFVAALFVIAYRSLAALVRWLGEGTERQSKAEQSRRALDDSDAAATGTSWRDLLPFSGWRLVSCAIFAGLVGSCVRNLADSDWYVPGIALPFWVLAGVLAAQSGAVAQRVQLSARIRLALAVVSAVLILLAVSFGAADYVAPEDLQSYDYPPNEFLRRYELASTISPLNPVYHRETARFLAESNPDAAIRHINTAIALAPTDARNYFFKGIVELRVNDNPGAAIANFRQALRRSPNSTQAVLWLSKALNSAGKPKVAEAALHQLIQIEQSTYEQVRGAPELVDTSFVEAHVYFGEKALMRRHFTTAADEFRSARDRLERWRENPEVLESQRVSGRLNADEEREVLSRLNDIYLGLASAYRGMGDSDRARDAARQAKRVQADIEKVK